MAFATSLYIPPQEATALQCPGISFSTIRCPASQWRPECRLHRQDQPLDQKQLSHAWHVRQAVFPLAFLGGAVLPFSMVSQPQQSEGHWPPRVASYAAGVICFTPSGIPSVYFTVPMASMVDGGRFFALHQPSDLIGPREALTIWPSLFSVPLPPHSFLRTASWRPSQPHATPWHSTNKVWWTLPDCNGSPIGRPPIGTAAHPTHPPNRLHWVSAGSCFVMAIKGGLGATCPPLAAPCMMLTSVAVNKGEPG